MLKNKYIFNYIESVLSNKYFAVFMMTSLFIFSFLVSTLDTSLGYWQLFTFGLTYNHFICLAFLPMTMFFNIMILNLFDENTSLVVRFKSTKSYIIELIKNIIISNTIYFICLIIVISTLMNLLNANFSINYIKILGTNDLIYMIFTIIKLYILMLLFSMSFLIIYKRINKIYSIILGFVFSCTLYPFSFNIYEIKNIVDIKLYIGNYFFDNSIYSSFKLQILSFIIVVIIYIIFLFILYKLYYKKTKRIDI